MIQHKRKVIRYRVDDLRYEFMRLCERENLVGWKLQFVDDSRTRYGDCSKKDKRIRLKVDVLDLDWQETRNCLLHEVAHALLPGTTTVIGVMDDGLTAAERHRDAVINNKVYPSPYAGKSIENRSIAYLRNLNRIGGQQISHGIAWARIRATAGGD